MRTLNGYPISELTTILDQPLPPQAYKALPGAAGLTDIDAGWQRRAFNKIFGLYGIGWGFQFNKEDIDIRHEEIQTKNGSKIAPFARVYGKFWFAYIDKDEQTRQAVFPVTGANSNQTGNEGYTLKGAITNAIGFGASMIGWQESVYLGARSHSNTDGFAEGKDWADITPADVEAKKPEPEPTKEPEPVKSAKIVVSYCEACLRILRGTCKPRVCECGGTSLKDAADVDAARRAVNKIMDARKPKSTPAPAPASTPATQPVKPDSDKSLAEKMGFESIKHAVCTSCGYAEPVNSLAPACKECGTENPWSVAQSHKNMLEMSANIKAKLELKNAAIDSKTVLDEIKAVCKNDRRLILSALSTAAGKTIKNYSECDIETMQKCLAQLSQNAGTGNESTSDLEPQGKAELCKAIYAIARTLNLGNPRQVIAEIGKTASKTITTAAQLSEDELLQVYRNFKERI